MREAQASIYLKDYQPPAFSISQTDLRFEIFEDHTVVHSTLKMQRNAKGTDELVLDGQNMELLSLSLDGAELPVDCWSVDANHLRISKLPDTFELQISNRIRPQDNTALEGLYYSDELFCTQCEAEGFRKITYYLDRPDVMAVFSTRIEADAQRCPILLSNGNKMTSGELADGRHFVEWQDPHPKPCYLFALVAGDLAMVEDEFVTESGRKVALQFFVDGENVDKCDHAVRSLQNAMRWDEQTYGREYDLDIYMVVAVNSFNMGAMENKGLNVFNSKYVLARPDTATDRDFQGIEGVIAHEYFHNWTGNRITCRDWFQLSLKEGLTVFRDQEFSADMGSRGVKRIEEVRILRAHQFPEDAGPMAHPVRPAAYMEINNFYTVTVYNKGAEVVRMQHNLLGAEGYRKATDLYFERHDGQAVTTDDFVSCMADSSGRDLEQFRRWYAQAGTPTVQVASHYDADARRYTLTCKQRCPPTPGQEQKQPFHFPFAVGLLDTDGNDIRLRLQGEAANEAIIGTRVLELREAEQVFVFEDVPAGIRPSLLRDFSAPVKIEYDYSADDLAFLMAHDSDDFNRWDASQTLVTQVILKGVADLAAGRDLQTPKTLIEAYRTALLDTQIDKDLLAEMLNLPGLSTLGEFMPQIDIEGLYRVREFTRRQIAVRLSKEFDALYVANSDAGEYRVDSASIARRSLRNACLSYRVLAARDQNDGNAWQAALLQLAEADNMTETLVALALLAESDQPEAQQALDEFYAKWQDDTLVLDKWFGIQAMADRADVLQRVQGLMEHKAFSIRNPNKVRALIGAFAAGNPQHFHAEDGSGYRFLADQILALDKLNPQVASRMTTPFTRWRRYDDVRQALMKEQLQRIAGEPGLSQDVNELVSKSLA